MSDDVPERRQMLGAERAYVESAKITDYLLNPDHPIGGDKAAYLMRFGFRRSSWMALEGALLAHAIEGEVVSERETPYGRHFAVEGRLSTPDGRDPMVRTVWMVALGDPRPRFVTAVPIRRRQGGGSE